MDVRLKFGVHETPMTSSDLKASCTLNLDPVITGSCNHFYYGTSSTEVSQFNNFGFILFFYGEMAPRTYIKIDQNSKYIFSKSISQNPQLIRNDENNIKYYWINFTVSYKTTLHAKVKNQKCYYFFSTVYHSIPYTQCCLP